MLSSIRQFVKKNREIIWRTFFTIINGKHACESLEAHRKVQDRRTQLINSSSNGMEQLKRLIIS